MKEIERLFMRIILDQGLYDLRNVGNTALLQVATERLRKSWPRASFEIITYGPHLLKFYFPYAHPVNPFNPLGWSIEWERLDRLHPLIPGFLWHLLFEIREEFWYHWPQLRSMFRIKTNSSDAETFKDYSLIENIDNQHNIDMITGADLFVATGSQYMTDIAKESALQVLDRLEVATKKGVPTAMVGQGIGPINDPLLSSRAKAVLPFIDLIFVREKLEAPKILSSFGVDPARVSITGDDAIELAYDARTNKFGSGIGVSLRVMPYTEIGNEHIDNIRAVLFQIADKHRAQLVALPISQSLHEKDERFIRQLLSGYNNTWFSRSKFYTPLNAIKNTGRCRLVVTGTYHAALFALAQGIPAVCLAKSASYINKLTGLADMFSGGCEVILLDDINFREKLNLAVENAWQSADRVRPQLLEAAARQIDLGHMAYKRIKNLVESHQ